MRDTPSFPPKTRQSFNLLLPWSSHVAAALVQDQSIHLALAIPHKFEFGREIQRKELRLRFCIYGKHWLSSSLRDQLAVLNCHHEIEAGPKLVGASILL